MKAAELIAAADALRPNHYSTDQKLNWLQRLDGQIYAELMEKRGLSRENASPYTEDTELLAPFPYGEELYLAYIFSQIDLNNAEIQKYNQSVSLLNAAWRSLSDSFNRDTPLPVKRLQF